MTTTVTPRLAPSTFDIPVTQIRAGYRSAIYFDRTRNIMREAKPDQVVTMQVFQKTEGATLCGMDEALAVLRTCAGYYTDPEQARERFDSYQSTKRALRRGMEAPEDFDAALRTSKLTMLRGILHDLWVPGWDSLEVKALHDGDTVAAHEPVMTITGPYHLFAHLESVYLGILARGTKVATNTRRVVEAANGKPVLFFADRFDHYATQGGDGYAAHIGGAAAHASMAMGEWWGQPAIGTMPHALIASYGGSVPDACEAFHQSYPDTDLVALVDFNNDCVTDSLACLERFGKDLKGVRLDTSENMVDECLQEALAQKSLPGVVKNGVNPSLVHNVRDALDAAGGQHVKIIVSGGFNAEKISAFEAGHVPVDTYAVGSSLLKGSNDFTADVVVPVAKVGRWQRDASRLSVVD